MRRHPDVALRRGDERAGVVVDRALAAEVSQKGANGGELPRRRRARLTLTMDLGEKGAERDTVQARGIELAAPDARTCGGVIEKLGQVAFVRAHRLCGGVEIKREKLKKRFEMRVNSARSYSHRGRVPPSRHFTPT